MVSRVDKPVKSMINAGQAILSGMTVQVSTQVRTDKYHDMTKTLEWCRQDCSRILARGGGGSLKITGRVSRVPAILDKCP